MDKAPVRCPICKKEGAAFALVERYHDPVGDKDYGSWSCPACEAVFAHPYEHPGPAWYAKFVSADSYEGLGAWRFDWALALGFKRGGRLLDVGCGTGNFLVRAREAGYRVEGVDLNPEAVGPARARGLTVHQKSLEDFAAATPAGTFDVVTMFDVIEHFDNPAEMVALAHKLLAPGGGLIVTTPNGLRPTPFGRDDFDSPPHHLTRWSPDALFALMGRHGFAVERSYFTYLPTFEFSRFFIGKATKLSLRLAKRLLYGRSDATLTSMMKDAPPNAAVAAALGDKSRRTRIVLRFEKILSWILAPVFLPMKAFYRLRDPKAGVTTLLLAVKK